MSSFNFAKQLPRLRAQRDRGEAHPHLDQILARDLSWVNDQAVCAQTDTEIFFPDKGEDSRAAKDLCNRRPLLEPCRTYALNHYVLGVWGGLSQVGRERLHGSRSRRRGAA